MIEKDALDIDLGRLLALLSFINERAESDDEQESMRAEICSLQASLRSLSIVVTDLTHEKYAAEAEVDRLRTALESIRDFEPAQDPFPETGFNSGCAECERAEKVGWPPSHLCNDHYIEIDNVRRRNESIDANQHWTLRGMARDALALLKKGQP